MQIIGISGRSSAGKDTTAAILGEEFGFKTVAFADGLKQNAGRIFMYDEATLFGAPERRNAVDPRAATTTYWGLVEENLGYYREDLEDLFTDAPELISKKRIYDQFRTLIDLCKARGEHLTYRYVLQRMGTEWGRSLWDSVWIHNTRRAIQGIERGDAYTRMGGLTTAQQWPPPSGVAISDSRFLNEAKVIRSWGGMNLWLDASIRVPINPDLVHASEPDRASFIEDGVDYIDHDVDNNTTLDALKDQLKTILSPAS